jgi:hypothetical protein
LLKLQFDPGSQVENCISRRLVFPVNLLLGFGNTHRTSAADRIASEHDTQVTINLQMSHPSGLVVLKKSTTAISPVFLPSDNPANFIF